MHETERGGEGGGREPRKYNIHRSTRRTPSVVALSSRIFPLNRIFPMLTNEELRQPFLLFYFFLKILRDNTVSNLRDNLFRRIFSQFFHRERDRSGVANERVSIKIEILLKVRARAWYVIAFHDYFDCGTRKGGRSMMLSDVYESRAVVHNIPR